MITATLYLLTILVRAKSVRPAEQLRQATIFGIILLVATINQCVVSVVNLASRAGTQCGQLYTDVCIQSPQN